METKQYLNGKWDFMPIFGEEGSTALPKQICYEKQPYIVPSNWRQSVHYGDFRPFQVMDYPAAWEKALSGLCHRTFTVNAGKKNKRVFLVIEQVAQLSEVYINGKSAARWEESFLPLKVDITDLLYFDRPNDIHVVCTAYDICTLPSGAVKSNGLQGSWYGLIVRGIWGNCYLQYAECTRVEDVFVTTSVRRKELKALVRLTDSTAANRRVTVRAKVLDHKNTVRIMQADTQLQDTAEVTLCTEWENPVLWDTDNPYLYHLQVELFDGDTLLDTKIQRFGFREFWNEGTKFILNGKRINLRGDSWHFQGAVQMTKQYAKNWYSMCRENGVNYIRLHAEPHPACYLEAADEVGMLLVDETAIYGSGKNMNAADERYINRCYAHVKRLVLRDRNHPSVIFWSVQNEMRWVDGRDVYKHHIPALMQICHQYDPTRKVSIDGDNRLISYENTELESLHYNIDGTLAQWRREKPLTIGEHCGLWYICPQNASAYVGMQAYRDVDESQIGFAAKERLFVEDARRKEVSGISTFNFAFYFMRSMPNEDVELGRTDFSGEGACKIQRIPKNALSINNGLLKNYPKYIPNPTMAYMRQAFKPVTIIRREYNSNFFDGGEIKRSFDIYNDTRHDRACTLQFTVTAGDRVLCSGEESWTQPVGERRLWEITIPPFIADKKTAVVLKAELFHSGKMMHRLREVYYVYPSALKTQAVSEKTALYYGNTADYDVLKTLLPNLVYLHDLKEAKGKYLLILGREQTGAPNTVAPVLCAFAAQGGRILILEQSQFYLGDIPLQKQSFFSAYTSTPNHPILKGLSDRDFMFWAPTVVEERPGFIISDSFVKGFKGDCTFVLECSAGDYADGGDLWSPLLEYKTGSGSVVMNQLEIMQNFTAAPAACLLLRNLLQYGLQTHGKKLKKAGALVSARNAAFLKAAGLDFAPAHNINDYSVVVMDAASANGREAELCAYLQNGGTLFAMPFDTKGAKILSAIAGTPITTGKRTVYHLEKVKNSDLTYGLSVADLYHYDKVPMSPRQVENTVAAARYILADGLKTHITDVTGTPWYDYYAKACCSEYSRIALVNINREQALAPQCFAGELAVGKGRLILCQLNTDKANEKDVRSYIRLFSNLSLAVKGDIFTYKKQDFDYSVDNFMTLPVYPYQNYEEAKKYYTDPAFSLNNLGEGLYGWMLKVEKNRGDGYIYVPNSKNKRFFLTCFVDYIGDGAQAAVAFDVQSNAQHTVYVNGERPENLQKVTLVQGVNRLVIAADTGNEDLKFIVMLKDAEGKPVPELRYHLTIDEVDPK